MSTFATHVAQIVALLSMKMQPHATLVIRAFSLNTINDAASTTTTITSTTTPATQRTNAKREVQKRPHGTDVLCAKPSVC